MAKIEPTNTESNARKSTRGSTKQSASQYPEQYWAFNSNPKKYNIEEAVRSLDVDTWTTKDRPVHIGNRVIIWKSQGGSQGRRGIVALAEVITEPSVRSDIDNPYWIDAAVSQIPEPRVDVRYVHTERLPIWHGDDDAGILEELSANGGQGTIFKVSPEQWSAVLEVIGGWVVDGN